MSDVVPNTVTADADTRRRPVIWNLIGPGVAKAARLVDRRRGWDTLGYPLGLLTLLGLRHSLREQNLYDPGTSAPPSGAARRDAAQPAVGHGAKRSRTRSLDGRGTHPTLSAMGAAGTRFSRNVPVARPQHDQPPAKKVSEALLKRGEFVPAESLNMLAAAWLQFEVHDWFAHQVDESAKALPAGIKPLKPEASQDGLPRYLSDQSHWWDASQLYGADKKFARKIRAAGSARSGKVKTGDALLKVVETFQTTSPSPVPNLWLGLALFHDIFAREHNVICDRLREVHPRWSGQQLYDQARMINAAVMAKIHTVEWTPALLAHRTTAKSIRSSWYGVLGPRFRATFGRIGTGEILSGIPGSWMDDDIPYALTEEFATVYRMHPLLPDTLRFRGVDNDKTIKVGGEENVPFEKLVVTESEPSRARDQLSVIGYPSAWYSLAVSHPGALTLHNHPSFKAPLPAGRTVDLGTADILRTRECRVLRYNDFRRSLRMPPATTFGELANGNAQFAKEIRKVYDGRIEDVDLIVGLMADRKPEGFAISDTAFRIFLLMAARRLRSDRFFTMDYTAATYTKLGLDWIEGATMAGILRRHYPDLAAALGGASNVFMPWPRVRPRAPVNP